MDGKTDYRKVITKMLKTEVKREGIDELIMNLDGWGFFTAACSGGNHCCYPGGLAEHSLNVCQTALKMWKALGSDVPKESVVVASLLHDLGKCGDFGKELYVPNMLKTGQSKAKPYKRNPDLLPIDHATRSIKLAALCFDLTEDEEYAIRYHDGLYVTANYDVKGHETPLYMLIHWADFWSCNVIEKSNKETEE